MGPVSAALLPTFRHLPISRQPLVVTRFSQIEEGRGVTPLLPAHDRRVPRPARVWHRPCFDSLVTATRLTAPAARRRLAGRPAAAPEAGRGARPRATGGERGPWLPHPTSRVACRRREMQGSAWDRGSWRQGTGGKRPMHKEYVETTWPEAMTALAVMGILAFLLLV